MNPKLKKAAICSSAVVLALCATGYRVAETTRKLQPETENDVMYLVGSSGTVGVKVHSFKPNDGSQECFPASQGWDKSYSTQYFLGPLANANPNPFPNNENVASVTVNTLHSSNGTKLATGIVISKNGAPETKVCATNVGPIIFPPNPYLSKATFVPTEKTSLYRVTIFYKGSTADGIENIFFNWSYP